MVAVPHHSKELVALGNTSHQLVAAEGSAYFPVQLIAAAEVVHMNTTHIVSVSIKSPRASPVEHHVSSGMLRQDLWTQSTVVL